MYYDEAADAVLKTLNTSEIGLSSEEAENRLIRTYALEVQNQEH